MDHRWVEILLNGVLAEYPNAESLQIGDTTGSAIVRLDVQNVFKVFAPGKDHLLSQEIRLVQSLKESCGEGFKEIFLPTEFATIGGYQGFVSPYFEYTLNNLAWNQSFQPEELMKQVEGGLLQAMERLELLYERTRGPFEERFAQELEITLHYIREQLHSELIGSLDYLPQIAEQLQQLVPPESSWCHRDLHLDNIASLAGGYVLFDPIPTFWQNEGYLSRIQHLNPPFKGHIFLDYAKLLVSLEREAAKLEKQGALQHRNVLLHLKQVYERKAEAQFGRAALHLGFTVYYGLYATCKCDHCLRWGIWDVMIRELDLAINKLLCDDLAHRFSDNRSFTHIHGGTQSTLIFAIPYRGQSAILKMDFLERADGVATEVQRNLQAYEAMPTTLRPAIFSSGQYERLHFLLMEHAGTGFYERLTAPLDPLLYQQLEAVLRAAYAHSAREDPLQVQRFYQSLLSSFEENLTAYIQPKHSVDVSEGLKVLKELKHVSDNVLPRWCFWTTTDFTVDNLFCKDDRIIFIDPKDAAPGIFEVDLGMFHTLIGLYTLSSKGGRLPIHASNAPFYSARVFELAQTIRGQYEPLNSTPFLKLGVAWQYTLSSRFREGEEAVELYHRAVHTLEEVYGNFVV